MCWQCGETQRLLVCACVWLFQNDFPLSIYNFLFYPIWRGRAVRKGGGRQKQKGAAEMEDNGGGCGGGGDDGCFCGAAKDGDIWGEERFDCRWGEAVRKMIR